MIFRRHSRGRLSNSGKHREFCRRGGGDDDCGDTAAAARSLCNWLSPRGTRVRLPRALAHAKSEMLEINLRSFSTLRTLTHRPRTRARLLVTVEYRTTVSRCFNFYLTSYTCTFRIITSHRYAERIHSENLSSIYKNFIIILIS